MQALAKSHCDENFQVFTNFCFKNHDQIQHYLQITHFWKKQQSAKQLLLHLRIRLVVFIQRQMTISHVLLLLVRIANNFSHSFLRVCCILCKCSLAFRGSSFNRTMGIPLTAFWLASSAFLNLPDFLITYRKSFHKWFGFCKNVMQRCWMIPYRTGNVFLFIFFLFGFNFLFSWWLKIIFMSSAYIMWGNSGVAATVWLKVLFLRV